MTLARLSALLLPIALILVAVGNVYVVKALGHVLEALKLQTAELDRLSRLLEHSGVETPVSFESPPLDRN
jgi:hypothetical protein